jgi:phage baseplate assembly protein W
VTKDLPILVNENAIIRSVRNLVETIPKERFFNPILGSNVRSSLFDFVDYGTASTIQTEIKTTISNFEPRVDNVIVSVDPQPDLNAFEVTINFEIIGQQIPAQQFTFLLEATR